MNNKKFGLKKASQIRNLADFTKDELDELKAVQCEVSMEGCKETVNDDLKGEKLECIVVALP
jgi:hypothetical protein